MNNKYNYAVYKSKSFKIINEYVTNKNTVTAIVPRHKMHSFGYSD